MLIPEMKTMEIQVPINKIDWPKSGWFIKKIIIKTKTKKLKKYNKLDVLISLDVKIFAVIKIKKGLSNSIGCKRKT